jgi:hypothetical protein
MPRNPAKAHSSLQTISAASPTLEPVPSRLGVHLGGETSRFGSTPGKPDPHSREAKLYPGEQVASPGFDVADRRFRLLEDKLHSKL